ncbi:acyltransferase family protein [Shewanella frigidimarina]|uniref:acyltransferase family protein n=1 Tax=Shewanella frigidimarina TaxID=56812 RepID=UPI003FA13296
MIYSVQYMRAIAALMVVFHHSAWKGAQYGSDPLSWFHIGEAGVDLFFIISGYIMCRTVDQKEVSIFSFIKARIRRIIPIYWLLTTLALVAFLIFPEKVNSSGGNTNVIASYFLFPTEDKFLIQNGWTLSFEFFFYFLFSFCLSVKSLYRYLIPTGIIFGLVLIGNIIDTELYLVKFMTSPFLLEFTFGILAFYFSRNLNCGNKFGFLLIIISTVLMILVNNSIIEYPRVIQYGIPALMFFLGMLFIEPIFKMCNSNIILKILKKIGDSSYSLYLFHPFALVICSIILSRVGLNQFGGAFIVLLVISSVVSGHLCYLLLEKPLAKLFKNNNKSDVMKSVQTDVA